MAEIIDLYTVDREHTGRLQSAENRSGRVHTGW